MRFLVLATDYDETLAEHGRVRPEVVVALERVKSSGRRLVLVTGRELPDLRRVFPELIRERSFYFKGRRGDLNLRAQNLTLFCQLAEGVDDETWLFHLQNGDYAGWFRRVIKDDEIAGVADEAAGNDALSPLESRRKVLGAILARYTLPAGTLEPDQP